KVKVAASKRKRERVSNSCLSFINIVETSKLPAAFGQFENEADRRVFPVIRSFLEWAIDLISLRRLFSRFCLCKTLGGICLAVENFVITTQETFLVLYGFYPIGHRQWEFRHLRDRRFIASDDCDFKFFPERRKIGLRKGVWKCQQNQNPS